MRKITLFLSIAILVGIIASCASNETADSSKVAQSEIYQSYFVNYDASKDELDATASFRFGGPNGTTLRLVDESKVSYNEKPMTARKTVWTGTSYQRRANGGAKGMHTFTYVNNDKQNFRNAVPLLKAEPLLENELISKSKGVVVRWDGIPLSSMDHVEIVIQDSGQSHYFSPKLAGVKSMTLRNGDLIPLKIGKGELYIVRRVNLSLQKTNPIGGVIGSEYVSKRIEIEIVP